MSTVNLGRVAILFKGEYDPTKTYVKLDVVSYNGSSYIAKGNTLGNLPTNTTYWDLMAEKGQDGATGPQGPTGNPGSSPIAVSSVDDMVDTDKIYVLTTDGHWYYNDGTNWVDGGVYQSTGISTDAIKYNNLETALKDNIVFNSCIQGELNETTDTFCGGSVGNTLITSSLANYRYGELSISEGDIVSIIPLKNQGTIPVVVICDSNDKILESYKYSDLVDDEAILKMPVNSAKLYFNVNGSYPGAVNYYKPMKITSYSYNDNRIRYTSDKVIMTPTEIKDKYVFSKSYWNYEFMNGYKTFIYDVKPNSKIHLNTNRVAGSGYYACMFTNDDLDGCYGKVGLYTDTVLFDDDIVVPPMATKMLVTTYNSTPIVEKYVLDIGASGSIYTKKLNVSYNNGELTIVNKANNNYVTFKNFGGNNLFMIYEYGVNGTNVRTYSDMTPAPYVVYAINNINGDDLNGHTFTGGNHQYNNQGSGSTATAYQQSLHIYCDGVALTDGDTVDCDEITIVEVNDVQATNTKKLDGSGRSVLEETITFKFDGKHLRVKNIIQPLEEIRIATYYGIQTCLFTNDLYKVYADKIYDVNTVNQVPFKPDAIIGNNLINAKMDSYGLGKYIYSNSGKYARISNKKSYYVPIENNNVHFTPDNTYFISGEYIFDENPEL